MELDIGAVVHYRSKTGTYTVPAMVAAVEHTLNPAGVEAGAIPALSSPTHVHLVVFTPGIPGRTIPGVEPPPNASPNQGGTYPEWDIPYDQYGAPGTWRWPADRFISA